MLMRVSLLQSLPTDKALSRIIDPEILFLYWDFGDGTSSMIPCHYYTIFISKNDLHFRLILQSNGRCSDTANPANHQSKNPVISRSSAFTQTWWVKWLPIPVTLITHQSGIRVLTVIDNLFLNKNWKKMGWTINETQDRNVCMDARYTIKSRKEYFLKRH